MPKNSEKFNELVESFANLPTIGKKTATRLAYFISIQNHALGIKLAQDIENAVRFIKPCEKCGGLSENELCDICTDTERDRSLLCVVESARDILIFENSGSFGGVYFVLDAINEDKITKLRAMIAEFKVDELIFALTNAVNADAISLFVEERLGDLGLKFTRIAQGIPSGVNLENVDLISLHKAMAYRTKTK